MNEKKIKYNLQFFSEKSESEEGGEVVLLARNEERLNLTFSELKGSGHSYFVCDLTDEEQVNKVLSNLSSLDGVVFCAGVNDFVPIKFIKQNKIDQIFKTNFDSQILLTQKLLKKKLINIIQVTL